MKLLIEDIPDIEDYESLDLAELVMSIDHLEDRRFTVMDDKGQILRESDA